MHTRDLTRISRVAAHRAESEFAPRGRRAWGLRTGPRTVMDQPSLLPRIERAIYRLQNTHGLPLRPWPAAINAGKSSSAQRSHVAQYAANL
jgi:hypothetical protein